MDRRGRKEKRVTGGREERRDGDGGRGGRI
jgi:hypothetical protein